MTKSELVSHIAKETGLTKTCVENIFNVAIKNIVGSLKKEGRQTLYGFGIFEVVKRKARTARNPKTNEPVKVKAHKVVKFKPVKALRDVVNKK